VISNQHHPRRLQLLTEINPDTQKVYYLYSGLAIEGQVILQQVTALAEELGVEIIPAPVVDVESGIAALENAPEDIDWFFLTPYLPFDLAFQEALVSTSEELQVPIAGFITAPTPGYLINYGPDLNVAVRQAAQITDRILRGAEPGELPIVIAENGLSVNLEVAETLQVEIPLPILRQADQIVRPGDLDNFFPPAPNEEE
jgi:putative ABC transport system substrate-binding protein